MGAEVEKTEYSPEERRRFRQEVNQELETFTWVLAHAEFDATFPKIGLELELNLVDAQMQPSMSNDDVLEHLGDHFQSELARFNIEVNVAPRPAATGASPSLEHVVLRHLQEAQDAAEQAACRVVPIGILPTLRPEHLEGEWISGGARYTALEKAILHERGGEGASLDIAGPGGERVQMYVPGIAPAAACTSLQLHLQVPPEQFAAVRDALSAAVVDELFQAVSLTARILTLQRDQYLPAGEPEREETTGGDVAADAVHVRHPERKDVVPAPVLVARWRQILIAKPWAVSSVGISGLNLMRILLIWHETCSCK